MSAADPRAAKVYADPSVYALIAANLLAVAIARDAGLRLIDMLAIYWVQSIIIGISHAVRITSLRRFSRGRLNMPEDLGPSLKWVVAGMFLIHYGMIQVFFGIYVDITAGYYRVEHLRAASAYWLCALLFLVNHMYSLYYNMRLDRLGQPSLHTLMFLPYARVLPFQVTGFLFGMAPFAPDTAAWILFAVSKTVADVAMHVVEHRVLRK